MMAKKKLVKIGFDLDGVIINKPPFIPNNIIEWLYRSHSAKKLSYRYPNTKFEKQVRQLSHHPLLRPPLKSNLAFIRNLSKNKKYKLYAISSRYSFLQSRTEQWFKKNNLEGIFEKVYLNTSDEQPHLFKERILNKLKPDIFIEDDPCVVDYLKDRLGKIKIRYLESGEGRVDELLGKRKPKILIGISYYLPNISGLTIYAQNLAEELVKREHVVKVLTSKHLKKLPESEEKNGVLIKRVWTPFIFGRGPIMPTYLFEAYRTIKKADVVNLHLPQFEAFFSALLAKLLKKKLVVTYHCDFSNWPGLINQITEKVAFFSHLVTCSFADKIIVSSKDYADNSKFLSLFKNKLGFVFPPIKLARADLSINKKWKSVKYKIGFVGRLAKEKGAGYLLQTVPTLEKILGNNFRIIFVGPSKEVIGGGGKKEITNLMGKFKKYLVLLGKINNRQLAGFYKSIDVLVLPSTQSLEAFGMVQVEAMISGCPVVASNLPGVRVPIKTTGMGKIIASKNAESLAKEIIIVLKNRKKYVISRRKVEKVFCCKKTIDAYEKILNNSSK